jgi:hypothetical protein
VTTNVRTETMTDQPRGLAIATFHNTEIPNNKTTLAISQSDLSSPSSSLILAPISFRYGQCFLTGSTLHRFDLPLVQGSVDTYCNSVKIFQ